MIAQAASRRDIACRLGFHRKRIRYPRALWITGGPPAVADATYCQCCGRLLELHATNLSLHVERLPAPGTDGIDAETG